MPVNLVTPVGDDLAGIEQVVRVEGLLDFLHHVEKFLADLRRQKFRARNANAVFTRERAFELGDQRGNCVGNLPEFPEIAGALQIQHRPDVQQPRRRVTVIGSRHTRLLHELLQVGNVGRQILRTHRCVLDEAGGLRVALAAGQQGQASLAHRPHEIRLGLRLQNQLAQTELLLFQQGEPLLGVLKKLHDQDGFAGLRVQFQQVARGLKFPLAARLVEQRTVNVLDGGGLEFEQRFGGLQRLGHR